MTEPIVIDGATGEGGGQVVRTTLALALATGRAVRIEGVRAGRRRPGLLRQHLTALNAVAEISGGDVQGARLGSPRVALSPGRVRHGDYRFAVGSAGSAALVLHTVVPGLLRHPGESRFVFEGGTDNPAAPPSRFLTEVWAPRVRQLGVALDLAVERRGFYPKGGGRLTVRLGVPPRLSGFRVEARGAVRARRAIATVSALPRHVAERELAALRGRLDLDEARVELVQRPTGPGNVLCVQYDATGGAEVFSAFGERGRPAEHVARDVARRAERWLAADVPVGEHQADQLVLLLALAGEGALVTVAPSLHTRTQLAVIERLLPVRFELTEFDGEDRARIEVRGR